jgi:hypothetical protein
MRQIILGLIFVVWGGALVISHFLSAASHTGNSAYDAGHNSAWLFGFVLFGVGAFALVNELRARSSR